MGADGKQLVFLNLRKIEEGQKLETHPVQENGCLDLSRIRLNNRRQRLPTCLVPGCDCSTIRLIWAFHPMWSRRGGNSKRALCETDFNGRYAMGKIWFQTRQQLGRTWSQMYSLNKFANDGSKM
ncbi:hypothetical protein J6590_008588 [Homalodisca vitripennis]|nr:hypothetical protein J6590_008588 [Homalodisca vitripennis]